MLSIVHSRHQLDVCGARSNGALRTSRLGGICDDEIAEFIRA